MFAIVSNDQVLTIDANISPESVSFIEEHLDKHWTAIFTHEHFDHISGINLLRQKTDVTIISSEQSSKNFSHTRRNMSAHYEALFVMRDSATQELARSIVPNGYTAKEADVQFSGELSFTWQNIPISLYSTPGHTKGSACICIAKTNLFTGDTLVNGFPAITKLPGGSRQDYANIALPFIQSQPENTIVFPGHGDIALITKFEAWQKENSAEQ